MAILEFQQDLTCSEGQQSLTKNKQYTALEWPVAKTAGDI